MSVRNAWNSWTRLLRGAMLAVYDSMILAGGRKRGERKEGAIFCMHGLGDLLLAGKAISRLAEEMRGRGLRVVLYVHPSLVDFARGNFAVEEVEGIERHRFCRSLKYRAKVLRSVAGRFSVAVQPTYNRMLRIEDCLVRATGAAERIGGTGHDPFITRLERRLGDRFYTKLVAQGAERMHELERFAEFMAGMGLPIAGGPWRLAEGSAGRAGMPAGGYLVVSPNASDAKRSWPRENFMRVAKTLAERHKLAVVVVGTEEGEPAMGWEANGVAAPELVDLRGRVATRELPGVLGGAKLVISNDSGVYHLGIAMNRPTVGVGGSGIPARYFPYREEGALRTKVVCKPVPCAGCNWKCIYAIPRGTGAPCIREVSWESVAAAGEALLGEGV